MKRLTLYVDASVIGGWEDAEFSENSQALWSLFVRGEFTMVLSEHTLRELENAPEAVRRRVLDVPPAHRVILADNEEADALAEAYLEHRVVAPSSRADALHVALATVSGSDVLVSWNFKHLVNLGRIRLFNAVNLEMGYNSIEIRSPKEVIPHEQDI
jgi:predicted nucleic acid-binding protein